MSGVLSKGPALQEGTPESADLVNGPVWLEKTEGKEERRGNSHLLRAYCVPGVVYMSHLMCTATPKGYHFALFGRKKQKLQWVKWSHYQLAHKWQNQDRSLHRDRALQSVQFHL